MLRGSSVVRSKKERTLEGVEGGVEAFNGKHRKTSVLGSISAFVEGLKVAFNLQGRKKPNENNG